MRSGLNPFFFFTKRFHTHKKHEKCKKPKKHKSATKQKHKKHKKHKNANKRISDFFKRIKRCLFYFCSLMCVLCFFVPAKFFRKKK